MPELMSAAPTFHLTPPQEAVVSSSLLTMGFSCVLQMPTGSGKTWLAKHAIDETLRSGHRAIYLAPTRALAGELFEKWSAASDVPPLSPIGIFTGDFGTPESPYPVDFNTARLL